MGYRTGESDPSGPSDPLREALGLYHLGLDELLVEGARGDELFVGAFGRDLASVEDDDPAGVHDGQEAVGYRHDGARSGDVADGLFERALVGGVELRGDLVEQQEPGSDEEHPGQGYPLALPAGEQRPAVPDLRIEAAR